MLRAQMCLHADDKEHKCALRSATVTLVDFVAIGALAVTCLMIHTLIQLTLLLFSLRALMPLQLAQYRVLVAGGIHYVVLQLTSPVLLAFLHRPARSHCLCNCCCRTELTTYSSFPWIYDVVNGPQKCLMRLLRRRCSSLCSCC